MVGTFETRAAASRSSRQTRVLRWMEERFVSGDNRVTYAVVEQAREKLLPMDSFTRSVLTLKRPSHTASGLCTLDFNNLVPPCLKSYIASDCLCKVEYLCC